MSTGSELDLQLGFQSSTGKHGVPEKYIFQSVTAYNTNFCIQLMQFTASNKTSAI